MIRNSDRKLDSCVLFFCQDAWLSQTLKVYLASLVCRIPPWTICGLRVPLDVDLFLYVTDYNLDLPRSHNLCFLYSHENVMLVMQIFSRYINSVDNVFIQCYLHFNFTSLWDRGMPFILNLQLSFIISCKNNPPDFSLLTNVVMFLDKIMI